MSSRVSRSSFKGLFLSFNMFHCAKPPFPGRPSIYFLSFKKNVKSHWNPAFKRSMIYNIWSYKYFPACPNSIFFRASCLYTSKLNWNEFGCVTACDEAQQCYFNCPVLLDVINQFSTHTFLKHVLSCRELAHQWILNPLRSSILSKEIYPTNTSMEEFWHAGSHL